MTALHRNRGDALRAAGQGLHRALTGHAPLHPETRLILLRCAVATAAFIAWELGPVRSFPGWVGTDAYAFWSFSLFIRSHVAAAVYDPVALGIFQHVHDGYPHVLPMLYPPPALLLFWPFGSLRLPVFTALWMGSTLALFLLALTVRRPGKILIVLMVLVAPASVRCWIFGQTGFLIGALLIGGLRLVRQGWPAAGGLVLGLLVLKPQLALLVPVALLASKDYAALAAAAISAIALCAISTAVFGWAVWPGFVHALQAEQLSGDYPLMPTVADNLRLLGMHGAAPLVAQAVAALVAVCCVWRSPRIPTVLAATFLATPYARIGDSPLLLGAIVLDPELPILLTLAIYFLPYVMGALVPFVATVLPIGLLVWASMSRRSQLAASSAGMRPPPCHAAGAANG